MSSEEEANCYMRLLAQADHCFGDEYGLHNYTVSESRFVCAKCALTWPGMVEVEHGWN